MDNDVLGGDVLCYIATETGFKGGDTGVAMMWLIRWGNSPEVKAGFSLFFSVFDGVPEKSVGTREFTV